MFTRHNRRIYFLHRTLSKDNFNNATKNAGKIKTGHSVTALYEIVPADEPTDPLAERPGVDDPKYVRRNVPTDATHSGDMLTLEFCYKKPDGLCRTKMDSPVKDEGRRMDQASADFQFANFGLTQRDLPHKANTFFEVARDAIGPDKGDYRSKYVELAHKTHKLHPGPLASPRHPVLLCYMDHRSGGTARRSSWTASGGPSGGHPGGIRGASGGGRSGGIVRKGRGRYILSPAAHRAAHRNHQMLESSRANHRTKIIHEHISKPGHAGR